MVPQRHTMLTTIAVKRLIMDYMRENQSLFPSAPEGISSIRYNGSLWVYLEAADRRSPSLLQIKHGHATDSIGIIPFYLIKSRPDRQIVSFMLGRGLCNLAEIREIDGLLYSRHAGSYVQSELVHEHPAASRIALWVHDCLTEDVDHGITLNRYVCRGGACISYDFGLAFSNRSYPPFYAWELGIEDASIAEHAEFLLDMISSYAVHLERPEEDLLLGIRSGYSGTCHEGLCRYYLRSFRTHFTVRLYYGRFFEKLAGTPFCRERVSALARSAGIHHEGCRDWKDFATALRNTPRRHLHLEGLDLSGADLRAADLRGAVLRDVNLKGADLGRADIRNADLRGANLSGANLRGAVMEGIIR